MRARLEPIEIGALNPLKSALKRPRFCASGSVGAGAPGSSHRRVRRWSARLGSGRKACAGGSRRQMSTTVAEGVTTNELREIYR